MEAGFWMAVLVAALAVGVALWLIDRWGPGHVRRSVECPEKKVPAEVKVVQTEGSFGALMTTDVESCSLLPEGPVTCDKACVR